MLREESQFQAPTELSLNFVSATGTSGVAFIFRHLLAYEVEAIPFHGVSGGAVRSDAR